MLKRNLELIKNEQRQALLTWHQPDGQGGTIPVAVEFSDNVDEEIRRQVLDILDRPIRLRDGSPTGKAFPGSSKHFLELPRVLARLGFRTRLF